LVVGAVDAGSPVECAGWVGSGSGVVNAVGKVGRVGRVVDIVCTASVVGLDSFDTFRSRAPAQAASHLFSGEVDPRFVLCVGGVEKCVEAIVIEGVGIH
ncbi:MAG: hypothetical protein LUG50_03885, partial [Planctomycetaceae bacterium]|nr:hypothetical protein [Planctomycetaceae bacterium]